MHSNINPSPTWRSRASSQYNKIRQVLEENVFLQAHLRPKCLTHGSYDRHTATDRISDIDIVLWCQNLLFPAPQGVGSSGDNLWTRDRIFHAVEAVLANDGLYRNKLIATKPDSICIKLDLGIKMEILPVVSRADSQGYGDEPFYMWRPEELKWDLGYAQKHQEKLSEKNGAAMRYVYPNASFVAIGTDGNFIPTIKVIKHLNARYGLGAASFHIECLLYAVPSELYWAPTGQRLQLVLQWIADLPQNVWYTKQLMAPCADRNIFALNSSQHWTLENWLAFQSACADWANRALLALSSARRQDAIARWQDLFGCDYFPTTAA